MHSCRGFCSVPVPLQSVQSGECGGLLWLCSPLVRFTFGVLVRHVGRLLDGRHSPTPFELVNDGDLLLLIDRMLQLRGLDTVKVSKFKGHADEGMVLDGRVREVDRLGNDAADEAADFGRRRVGDAVFDAHRNLSGVFGCWYHVILDLHRFFIAISRAVVNHDGHEGTAPDPMVWSAGARPKRRRLVHAVRDQAFLLGPPGIWDSEWVTVPASSICAEDIAHWLIPLVFWLSGSPFQQIFTGLLVVLIWVHCPRGEGLFMLSITWLCFLDFLLFGLVNGLLVVLLLLVLMMLRGGLTLLVFWLSGSLS